MVYQRIVLSLLRTLGLYSVYKLLRFFYNNLTSPLCVLPGPPSASIIFGNQKQIWEDDSTVLHEKWVEEYGSTITYKGLVGTNRLYTVDTKAVNHVLMNSYIYQKPETVRYLIGQVLNYGVLLVEEDKHKQQRRVMNPAFGAAQVRELTEIFVEKSIQLRDIWAAESSKEGSNGHVEVFSGLSKMTLDVIGLAGFDYHIQALTNDSENELNRALSTIFRSGASSSVISLLRGMVPFLRFLPAPRDAKDKVAVTTMARIGNQLLRDSQAAETGGGFEKNAFKRRDLLSLLVRANMSTDLPPSQRMSDDDVLAQFPTFLVVGHETTSAATTWGLFALTQNPEVQDKLRQELLAVGTDNPTMDELNALPYLDAVVRETLRLHPPLASTMRTAAKDDILPLGEPVQDKNGNVLDSIEIKKGDFLLLPMLALNRSKSIWGDDAFEFKPERWEHVSEKAAAIPGIWGNMMTFIGGPRGCIGYRFALVEMKALLFTLIRAFEFELAVPLNDVDVRKGAIAQRPFLKSAPEAGNQMPLILKPVQRG